jgi:hypothetical protein
VSEIWLPTPRAPKEGPLVYFMNAAGEIRIPPVADVPTPQGWQRYEVRTAKQIEWLSKKFAEQKRRIFEQMDEENCKRAEAYFAKIRASLHHTMQTTHSQYEKDAIRAALKNLEDDEHKVKQRQYELHLEMEAKEAPLK